MGNTSSLCSTLNDCEKAFSSQSKTIKQRVPSGSICEEKHPIIKDSFKMSSEDLKLSHQDFRRFLLSKLKRSSRADETAKSYYELYKNVTKDRVGFESIYWLFSIKWIEYTQSNAFSYRGKFFETAVTVASIAGNEKENGKANACYFLKYIVEEIINNNYKITQIMEKFRSTFFKLNQIYFENDEILENLEEETLKTIKNQMIKELETYLIDPLKDFIVFFYSSALEKIVFYYLGQSFPNLNLFIIDIIHNLVFKSQNRIYNILCKILNLSTKKESLILQEKMSLNENFSLATLMDDQEFIIPGEILLKAEEMNFFENAFSKLRAISDVRTPMMKLELISQIQIEILNALAQVKEYFNLDFDFNKMRNRLDADQMISLYCYVVVKSNHYEIYKELKFIGKFIDSKLLDETQWGYLYEILRSSVDYILTLNVIK